MLWKRWVVFYTHLLCRITPSLVWLSHQFPGCDNAFYTQLQNDASNNQINLPSAISTLKHPRDMLWKKWVVFYTHLLYRVRICHQFGCLTNLLDTPTHFILSSKMVHQLIRSTYFQPSVLWNKPETCCGRGELCFTPIYCVESESAIFAILLIQ